MHFLVRSLILSSLALGSAALFASEAEAPLPIRQQYLNPERIAQGVRFYDASQPVLVTPWKTVPASQGLAKQNDYLLKHYPALDKLAPAVRTAALRGLKYTLPPILERDAKGTPNPVFAAFASEFPTDRVPKQDRQSAGQWADLYFHSQSPLASATPEVRAELLKNLLEQFRTAYQVGAQGFIGDGGGEYPLPHFLKAYLLLEIFEPDALSAEEKRTINRLLTGVYWAFNGPMGAMLKYAGPNISGGNFNHDVFGFNSLLRLSAIIELQRARAAATGATDPWPKLPANTATALKEIAIHGLHNAGNGLMGDGAPRYSSHCSQAYFYEGPQFEMQEEIWLSTYDEDDAEMLAAHRAVQNQIIAKGNYFEQVGFRIIEKDPDSMHTVSRALFSEGKSFGNELVNRNWDGPIQWAFANMTGNRWIRHSGPAVLTQRQIEKNDVRLSNFRMQSLWNPAVTIVPDPVAKQGYRGDYLVYDRNSLGATGKFGDWGFHFVARGQIGRRQNETDRSTPFFEKDTHAGFMARNSGGQPDAEGLRTDHEIASLFYVGIFPERRKGWTAAQRASGVKGPTLGYRPHYSDVFASATVTDQFAVQTTTASVDSPILKSNELWLATPNGAVGLLQSEVDTNPAGGDGQARLSFYLHGYFGTKIRNHIVSEGFAVTPLDDPKTFPVVTPDKTGFTFGNLQVRVLEDNFPSGPGKIFDWIKQPSDLMPTDKESAVMCGMEELKYANNGSHGSVTREVQSRGRFADGTIPQAVVAVQTRNAAQPITAVSVPPSPKASHPYLALEAKDGDRLFFVLFNPSDTPLDLRGITAFAQDLPVLAFQSGARFRPDFVGNIEVDAEVDMEDEVVFGSAIQNPVPRPLSQAAQVLIPPHAHVVFVSVAGGPTPKTGGPGLDARPAVAHWNFNPEQLDASGAHRDLTGHFPAFAGGVKRPDAPAAALDGKQALRAAAPAAPLAPDAGTVRFWLKPVAPSSGDALLFQSPLGETGTALSLIWRAGHVLAQVSRGSEIVAARRFDARLSPGVLQHITFTYASPKPEDWTLRVNTLPQTSAPDSSAVIFPAPAAGTLLVGQGFAGEIDELAIHSVALTPAELGYLYERELPMSQNRIAFQADAGVNLWLNGNRLSRTGSGGNAVEHAFFARYLRPGLNIVAIEVDAKKAGALNGQLRINGHDLTPALVTTPAATQVRDAAPTEIDSFTITAYEGNFALQRNYIEELTQAGKKALPYRTGWYNGDYDRPWIYRFDPADTAWRPGSWTAQPKGVRMAYEATGKDRLVRIAFTVDASGVPVLGGASAPIRP